ncbi:MAG: DUF1206 domain-containing protein [Nocardioidaceae bacterium]|nr:DUF1206 domain-containing protein [Nocardioidaceae bacterium]
MTDAKSAAQQVENSEWLERLVRVGLIAYGIVHLLIAYLALQLAFGQSEGAPSQQGALQEVAQKSYGTLLLWIIALGFLALAIWQFFDALWGHRSEDGGKRTFKRVGSAGRVVVYLALGFSAAKSALGEQSKSNEDHLTAQVMELPLGRLIVGAAGLGVIFIGGYLVSKAVRTSFDKDLQSQATSGSTGTTVVRLGQAGYTAKGVALAIVGALLVWAAWTYDSKKAGGLDVALRTLLDESFGPWLLAVVAVGIGCFGVYCFFWARYADTNS